MLPSVHRQSGVALISVLLIFAIAAVLATRMMSEGSIQLERTADYQQQQQLSAYARGAESYALALLADDWLQDQSAGEQAYDHPSEAWGQLDLFPLEEQEAGDQIRIRILPLEGFFNLNSLLQTETGHTDGRSLALLRRLLAQEQLPDALADQALDWLDSNAIPTGLNGAEDNDYLLRQPAHRSADQPLLDTDELLWLKAGDAQQRYRFSQQVVALPQATLLNLNACNPDTLAVMMGLSRDQAEQLLAGIEFTPVTSVAEFISSRGLDAGWAAQFTTRSRYFMVTVQVDWQQQRRALTTLVDRDPETGRLHILQRRYHPVPQSRFQRQLTR